MYIAPPGDCSLLTLNLPFKVILKKFEVVFSCLHGVRMLHFSKDKNSLIQNHQYCMYVVWLFKSMKVSPPASQLRLKCMTTACA